MKDFNNRHETPLPKEKSTLEIMVGDETFLVEWKPFSPNDYTKETMPSKEYLGTATNLKEPYKGIGFHAWDCNDSEFVFWRKITNNE